MEEEVRGQRKGNAKRSRPYPEAASGRKKMAKYTLRSGNIEGKTTFDKTGYCLKLHQVRL